MFYSVNRRHEIRICARFGRPHKRGESKRRLGSGEASPNESARIADLRRYAILDTPAECPFDVVARVTAQIYRAPIALVSLIDSDRQWFKARYGLRARQTPRNIAVCAHTVLHDDVMVVSDAKMDARFAGNPLVLGPPNARFSPARG